MMNPFYQRMPGMFNGVERTGHAGSEADIPLRMSLLLRNGKLATPKDNKRDFKKKHKNRLQYD